MISKYNGPTDIKKEMRTLYLIRKFEVNMEDKKKKKKRQNNVHHILVSIWDLWNVFDALGHVYKINQSSLVFVLGFVTLAGQNQKYSPKSIGVHS